jgi:mitochondrial fission protein ELM1
VLLGGRTRAVRFDRSAFEVLASKLEYQLAHTGGSVMVCGSRRTPPALAAIVRDHFCETPGRVWLDAADGDNFYAGALAWADRIIVSPDSVNMVSEACATRVPVFVAEPGRATGRIRRFLADLEARGRIRPQTRDAADFAVEPLQESARMATQVRLRLGLPREDAWRY